MKSITEKDQLHLEWYKQSRKEMTNEEIEKFNEEILNGYHHDYGTICHAVAASTLAHLNNCLYRQGMTGAQASFATWGIINQIFNIKVGGKLVSYDKMLYPQYEDDFSEKIISKHIFESLQEKAKEKLSESDSIHPRVKAHMESIVDGKIPFGYIIKD